ncbi:MAG: hypothetical protein DRJ38_05715 [Thermoprotei archaeon]|nr:MAG: hypothetical protein DRJ38_05715 [Thermoprotei archaeon]
MSRENDKNVFELVLEMLEERFKDDNRKASLAKRIFKEFLISGKRGLDRIVREEIYKALESEDGNETTIEENRGRRI